MSGTPIFPPRVISTHAYPHADSAVLTTHCGICDKTAMTFLASAAQGDLPLSLVLNTVHGICILCFYNLTTLSDWTGILSPFDLPGYFTWFRISAVFFSVHLMLNLIAFVYLVGFYVRTVRMVWNKQVPALGSAENIRSFYNYLLLVRPMTILWRRYALANTFCSQISKS